MTKIHNTEHLKYKNLLTDSTTTTLYIHNPNNKFNQLFHHFLSVESQLSKLTFLGKNARTDYQWACKHFAKQFGTMSRAYYLAQS